MSPNSVLHQTDFFTESESAQLQDMFHLTAEQLTHVVEGCAYVFEQAGYFALKPATFGAQLGKISLAPQKACMRQIPFMEIFFVTSTALYLPHILRRPLLCRLPPLPSHASPTPFHSTVHWLHSSPQAKAFLDTWTAGAEGVLTRLRERSFGAPPSLTKIGWDLCIPLASVCW